MATEPAPRVGDRVTLRRDVLARCPDRGAFHRVRSACLHCVGQVDSLTAANGGVQNGHGTFVTLECAHACRVALAQAELLLRG